MRRLPALLGALTLSLALVACGGGDDEDEATATKKERTTTTTTEEARDDAATTSTTVAADLQPSSNPTTPPEAPPDAAPLDITGEVWAIEPISGEIAVQTLTNSGANGVVLILADEATIKGAASVSALKVGQPVRVVGFSERLGERRVFTAVEVYAG